MDTAAETLGLGGIDQDGDLALRAGEVDRALEHYLEAAAAFELAPAELCVKIARCHERLDALDEAFAWLVRVVDASDSFIHWSAAASTLGRLTTRARPRARASCRLALTGSYTTSQLASMLPLAALRFGVDLSIEEGLFNQYQQDLIDPDSGLHVSLPQLILIAVHEGALRLPSFSADPEGDVGRELERWRGLWQAATRHSDAVVLQHTFARRPEAPFGHLSDGIAGSRYAMVGALNRRLYEAAGRTVGLVDCDRIAADFGRERWFDDRYWYRSKQAVALDAVPLLARHTAAAVAARLGLGRKCLVVDLDNTLWGGTIGEEGLAGIVVGGDGPGEAFAGFQEYIGELKDRGVILAVASKNNEGDVREAFEQHPGMRLRIDDFAAFEVNWEDKPANLRRIAAALDIGIDSLVLADDNPAERQIVRQLLPEVDVVALPQDPAGYRRALAQYLGFEPAAITAEDRRRTSQYRARAAAAELLSSASDIETFYRDLRMQAAIGPFDEERLARVAQLVAKTNQFNLTTRRHNLTELRRFMLGDSYVTRYLELSDRFIDHGLVALLIGHVGADAIEIESFLMSCRVIGRTVEAKLLANLSDEATRRGCRFLRGTYVPTAKNEVVSDLYARLGFSQIGTSDDGSTSWEYDLVGSGPIVSSFIEEVDA